MKTTQLHEFHAETGHMTEFAGYDMPVWYTSTSDEHLAVRNHCGAFDVSHMGRVRVSGQGSGRLLERLVPTDVVSQPTGKAIYTLFLNERAGILDDLIILKMAEEDFIVVVNAANAEADLEHIQEESRGFDASIRDDTASSAMIALQGPDSRRVLQPLTTADLGQLKRFRCQEAQVMGHASAISRTGYTGEDGYEIIVYGATNEQPEAALEVWRGLVQDAKPCGLAARDSLRTEAGYPLYGSDIGKDTDPFVADLAWVLSASRQDYIGGAAVASARDSPPKRIRRGLVLDEKIPRAGFEILDASSATVGRVTSGTFSPILRKGIAVGLVEGSTSDFGTPVKVRIRDSTAPGNIARFPFYDEKLYGWKRQSNGK
ncbi:MAG TPA: glycine cleavage system aminomethyltransferase GcvT [Nitrososphaerales archaeon]|nr:glycine cleavage system aminomethyltransferase GcvT [Nitrososphaerales archaeon]